jgi:tetratricopeptide (TPR) repeat protein
MLEREVEDAPEDAFHWFNLANAYSVGRRRADAIRAARKCLEHISPQNSFGSLACQILASSLTVTGKPDEALEACEIAEKNGSFTILTQFEKAHALHRLERFEEALAAIEVCLGMEWPQGLTGDFGIKTHKSHSLKGQILTELGRLTEAEECLRFALAVDPAFPVALYALGINLEKQQRFEEAIDSWQRILTDVEFGNPASRAAARVVLALGRIEEAQAYLESAWRSNPTDADAWARWTQLVEEQGRPEAMVRCYEAWAAVQDVNSDVLVNWGRALESLGDVEGALDKLLRAITLEPGNSNAFFNAGDVLYRAGRFADAAEAYQAGIKLAPENAEGWFVLGNALAQMGIDEGAEIAYRQVLSLHPGHTGANHNLAALAA